MVMTNAERQRAFRDRRRGGPAVGRWDYGPDHAEFMRKTLERLHICAETYRRVRWVTKHYPDLMPVLMADSIGIGTVIKIARDHRRMAREHGLDVESTRESVTREVLALIAKRNAKRILST